MALGRIRGGIISANAGGSSHGAPSGPKRAPGLQGVAGELLLLEDVHAWTHTARAAELSAPAKRMRTYLGGLKPSVAMRIPALVPEQPNYRRVRETIIARSRVLRPTNNRPQP